MKKLVLFKNFGLKTILILGLSFLFSNNSWGQTQFADGDYRSSGNGNWNSLATWQVRTTGSWAAASVLPAVGSNVFVQAGHTITMDGTVLASDGLCNNLHLNTAGILAIGGGYNVQVNGKIRAWTGAAVITTGVGDFNDTSTSTLVSAMLSTTSTSVLKFVGGTRNITNSGEWNSSTTGNAVEFALNTNAVGTLGIGIKFKPITFSSGIITTGAVISLSTGNCTIKNGARLISSRSGTTSEVLGNSSATPAGTVTIESGGILELTGTTPTISCNSFVNNGTVIYSGTAQTLLQLGTTTTTTGTATFNSYSTLILSGSGTKTLSVNTNIANSGSLSLQGTATLALNSFTLSYGTNTTLEYARTSNTTVGVEWPSTNSPTNVSINSSSSVAFSNTSASPILRTVTGTFTLNSSGGFQVDDNSGSTPTTLVPNVLTFANGSTIIRTAGPFNLSGGTYSIGSSSTDVVNLTINGNGLTSTGEFTSGSTNPGRYGVLTINTGNTYTLTSSGKTVNSLVLNGNISDGGATLTVRGNITGTGTHSGTGKILMSGNTTSSSISGATFGNIDLNDSDGFSLSGSPTVNGVLSLAAGVLATSSNNLIINASGSVTKTSGWVNGNLKKFIPSNATTATFEIGDASNYTPVTTAFTGTISEATGSIIAKTTATDHPSISGAGIYSTKSVNRYWTLTNDNTIPGLTSYDPTFTFVSGDIDASASTNNLVVRNYRSSAWYGTTTGTQNALTTQATGVTTFGDFAIGELKVPVITNSGSLLAFTTTEGNPSVAQSITISGADMNAGIVITPPTGFEVATSSDFSTTIGRNSSPLTVGSSGTINSTTVYVRMDSSTTVTSSPYTGSIALSSSSATTVNVSIPISNVTSTAVAAVNVSVTSLLAFAKTTAGTNSTVSQNFVVSGVNLDTNTITITPPTNFKISLTDNNANYSSSAIVLTPSNGTVANTTIYVKYSPIGTGNVSGNSANISITNGSVTEQTIAVTGNGLNTFYYTSNSIATPSNWKALSNGTGDSPANFIADGVSYKIVNNAITDAAWTVSGIGSKVILGDSASPAVTFTIADTFPLSGTIDITAASSGSNSLILNNNETVTNPVTPSPIIFGSLDATSEVHFRCLITISGSYTFGKVFVDGGSMVNFPSFSGSHRILTSLEVAQNSLMFGSGTAANYLNCSGATVTINGTLRTTRTTGFTSNSITPGSAYGVIQFSGVDAITLGSASTIEYSRDTSSSTQSITPRTDYKNVLISGANNIKTLSGSTTISGTLTLNMSSNTTATTVVISSLNTGSNNLTLSGTASAVFGPGAVLNITGGTTDFGGRPVTLQSTSAGTARIGTITGNNSTTGLIGATKVTVERYIPAKRAWRALTSPLKGSTNNSVFYNWQNNGSPISSTGVELWGPGGTGSIGNGLTYGPSNSILQYNNTGTTGAWNAVTNTNSTNIFDSNGNNAFMAYVTGPYETTSTNIPTGFAVTTLKATGQLITGTKTYTNLPSGVHTLIGNPYASPISPLLLLNANASFGNNLWIWDANGAGNYSSGAYNIYDKAANTYTNITNSTLLSTIPDIQSGQAFFVKASTGTATFTISESNKSNNAAVNTIFKTSTLSELLRVGLYKQVNNEWSGRDGAMTVILSDADANQPSNKMANSSENIAFTKNGASFASNHHLPLVATDVLNVKVWNTAVGANYKLKINTEEFTATNLDATLEDVFTNARTPLILDGTPVEYPFTVTSDALSTGDRFRIVFQSATLATNIPKTNGFSIVPNPVTGDSFQVNLGTLATGTYYYSICNSIGQEVEKGSINNANQNLNCTIKMSNSATGIYIMKIKGNDNSVFTAKIIKK